MPTGPAPEPGKAGVGGLSAGGAGGKGFEEPGGKNPPNQPNLAYVTRVGETG
jgi:hypothetical protein